MTRPSRAALLPGLGSLVALLVAFAAPAAGQSFVNFETGQVRPLALSPDGTRLFAVNTPDNRLEVFAVGDGSLTHLASVPVGLEPTAVAARSDSEVWVVNHLSDSLSIVDVAATPPRVVRTIVTCDEPRDIVFAGPGNDRAFVTTARRGQTCSAASNADLTTPGIGRAVVQVWNANDLGTGLRGNVLTEVVLFGDTPRALARSADGNTVYAAVFHSGNQTTALNEGWVCDGGAAASPCTVSGGRTAPGGLPAPNTNVEGRPGPEVGLIVKFDRDVGLWEDELGRDWSDVVRFDLPDLDVFAIDAAAPLPVETASFPHVGTVLFDIAVNPASGKVYVSNTEARNEVRFEGPGVFAGPDATTVQGHLHEARITVVDGTDVLPRHLNKHIDYDVRPAPPGVAENSLATPLGMAVSADGATLYVAAFGSDAIGVFDTAALEADSFTPSAADHIALGGGGPTGLVLDEARGQLYVLTRFDNALSVVDVATRTVVAHTPLFDVEPSAIAAGRPLLYDARATSSNGEASCSSCHVFGDFDSLAWDLGNPDDEVLNNPLPFRIPPLPPVPNNDPDFHPLKGPMTTQSLRGMANHGSMHWRGDRTGGNDPGGSSFDEEVAFAKFNPAFVGLIGRAAELPDADMKAFTDFILTVTYPPNPIRNLDQTLTTRQQEGRDLYFGPITDVLFNCNGCHTLDPGAGFFGSDGFGTFEGETQMFKVPHLRNAYQKIGMFGRPQDEDAGPQVRGFGFLHDGSVDTVTHFLGASVFTLTGPEQRRLEEFVLAFDSNLAPVVGQQATLTSTPNTNVAERVDLLTARAQLGECDLVVKGSIAGETRGGLLLPSGSFQLDREHEPPIADADLRALALTPGQELTYTCAPPGSGTRIGVDRDEDGFFDGDESDLGTDPSDPADFPGAGATPIRATLFKLRDDPSPPEDPARSRLSFRAADGRGAPSGVVVPAWGSAGDPTAGGSTGGGAVLKVYRADRTEAVELALPAALWTRTGTAARPGYRYRDATGAQGPIRSITLRGSLLVVNGKGLGSYPLDSAPQGEMALRLTLGSELELCAAATPEEPAALRDTTALFQGARNAAAPAECPRTTVP
jgi:DNA-binding beta-propeller fold protein YncE